MKAHKLITVPVQMTAKQQAVFEEIAKLQDADAGDTLLVLASLWIRSFRGESLEDYVQELGEGLWSFVAVRNTPENELYKPEPASPLH